MLYDEDRTFQYSTQRRFPRYPVDRPLSVVLNWPDTPTMTISGRCRVIGEGGIGAVMSQQFRVGEVVYLQLNHGLRVYAAVRSQTGFMHGFEFVLLRDAQRHSIRQLCGSSS